MSRLMFYRALTSSCSMALLTLLLTQLASPVLAGTGLRPGLPGRRIGAGTRGEISLAVKPLMALIPESYLSLTASEYPTFFFYIPSTLEPMLVEFVLRDKDDQQVYETTFTLMPRPEGIMHFTPPMTAIKPLELGQNYRWYFSIIRNPSNRAEDDVVEGWVRRVDLNSHLASQLQRATPIERVTLYAQAGIWQDALTTLAESRRSAPDDRAIAAKWAQLLQSINLPELAQTPLIDEKLWSKQSSVTSLSTLSSKN